MHYERGQEDFPALDRGLAQQSQRRPRLIRELDLDDWLTGRAAPMSRNFSFPVTQWATQHDNPVVCEGVHKCGVLPPVKSQLVGPFPKRSEPACYCHLQKSFAVSYQKVCHKY